MHERGVFGLADPEAVGEHSVRDPIRVQLKSVQVLHQLLHVALVKVRFARIRCSGGPCESMRGRSLSATCRIRKIWKTKGRSGRRREARLTFAQEAAHPPLQVAIFALSVRGLIAHSEVLNGQALHEFLESWAHAFSPKFEQVGEEDGQEISRGCCRRDVCRPRCAKQQTCREAPGEPTQEPLRCLVQPDSTKGSFSATA